MITAVNTTIEQLLQDLCVLKLTLTDEKLIKKIKTLYDCAKDVQSVITFAFDKTDDTTYDTTHECKTRSRSVDSNASSLIVVMPSETFAQSNQSIKKYTPHVYTHRIIIDTNTMCLQNLSDNYRPGDYINNVDEFTNKKFYYTITNYNVQHLYKFKKHYTYYICDDNKLYQIINNKLTVAIYGTHTQMWSS